MPPSCRLGEIPSRLEALTGLIPIDLDNRYQRKQSIGLEHYLQQFPELGTAATVAPELIHEEFVVRQKHDQFPSLDEYRRRFPNQFARLRKIIESEATPRVQEAKSTPMSAAPSSATDPVLIKPDDVEEFLRQKGYFLFDKLGAGGSGEVRRAEAPGGIEVAVKIIRRRSGGHTMANREQEALELIKKLRHPYLLQTQAYWSLDDALVIVMELADRTLSSARNLPRDQLLSIFLEAAEAIDFLHTNNIQHRDVKPANILLLGEHAKVADFGLARFQDTDDQRTGMGAGTPDYIAPELLSGMVSKHSDQFSLALSYAELRLGTKALPETRGQHRRVHERPRQRLAEPVRV